MEIEGLKMDRSCVVLRVLLWASTDHCVRFVKLNTVKQKGGSAPWLNLSYPPLLGGSGGYHSRRARHEHLSVWTKFNGNLKIFSLHQ